MALPTRIKINIRDLWNNSESEVQKSISALGKLVGYDIVIEPEWQLLWTELQKQFSDPCLFVPSVASIVSAWCKSLSELAEDESNEAWTEELLERLSRTRFLKDLFDVSDGRPSTRWTDKYNAFEICFPKSAPPKQSTMIAGFHEDLRHAFKQSRKTESPNVVFSSGDDGFTEIDPSDFDSASILTPATTGRFSSRSAVLESLPNLNTIERPEDLMKKPPYHMIIHHSSYGKLITIQCSHQPSLELISEYFKKWLKRNHGLTNKPPAAEITIKESCFGLSLLYDRLEFVMDSYDYKHGLSPTLILTFVESILGYRMTYNDASSWTFRRDTGFR